MIAPRRTKENATSSSMTESCHTYEHAETCTVTKNTTILATEDIGAVVQPYAQLKSQLGSGIYGK